MLSGDVEKGCVKKGVCVCVCVSIIILLPTLNSISPSAMVDMCREKKTGVAEECRQSDGKRALRACTQWGNIATISDLCHPDSRCVSVTYTYT